MTRSLLFRFAALLPLLLLLLEHGSQAAAKGEGAPVEDREPLSWSVLDPLQGAVTRSELVELLDQLYAPDGRWQSWIRIEDDSAAIRRSAPDFSDAYALALRPEEADRPAADLSARQRPSLRGLRIAIDPGHIGGLWGPMEQRSFAIGDGPVVQEGDLTLATARRLKQQLERLGAVVWLTRDGTEPVTLLRPIDFEHQAGERLASRADLSEEARRSAQTQLAERLFYVVAEIKARAEQLNREFRPDLALVLHINAAAWSDPQRFSLTRVNNGHVIVHGCYLADELADEETRLQMLQRLLKGHHRIELPLARAMAESMVEATGLPPYRYSNDNAWQLDTEGYVWARNLLANRIFDCPVVYLEPWIANSEAVYEWAAAGDFDGVRTIAGEERRSLPVAYADFVIDGLVRYCDSDR